MAQILLHGTLDVTIFKVDKLGDEHSFHKMMKNIAKLFGFGPKIYATIDLEKEMVGRTRMIENEPDNPGWDEFFHIYCAHMASNVIFTIKDGGATLIGRAYLPVHELLEGEVLDRWVEILDENKNPIHEGFKIHVKLQFYDVSRDHNWGRGIKSSEYPGVPYTYFPQRSGCQVSLYQDAHVPDNFVPQISLSEGQTYKPRKCWEDVFDAINNAEYLIYIAGWSVYTEITLIRDSKGQNSGVDDTPGEILKKKALGEILKKKASEGVKVLMLVWDDITSVDWLKNDGLMATHCKETKRYFEGTDVHCVLCPRNSYKGQNLKFSATFTHHQKIVLVDSAVPEAGSKKRGILSFVGGIDLCDGRYDTPSHSLFRTLDTAHRGDFHQPNFTGASITKGGPREPWHDIHCRLEGPIARDVLSNFEQRWRKQGGKIVLLNLRELDDNIVPPSPVMHPDDHEDDHESWNVQLFRSIDSGAASGFPDTPKEAKRKGLISWNDNIIDRSIQDAYIHAIRRAKQFIYIENQYFLGGGFDWDYNKIKIEDIGALHLIPKELSLKIVSKIKAGERFTVYIVVPMWPEGIPEIAKIILDFQRMTMEMMYKDIIQALQDKRIEDPKRIEEDPRNYLTFFCLGNREVKMSGEYEPSEQPKPDSDYLKAQKARRFMIYVHSKMMIVDDEYIIIGSANINQRSMDGARDSEIAMGAYQPHHLAIEKPARGQVYRFRMALWYEHLGMLDETFLHPESEECISMVNQIADKYWKEYVGEKLERDLPGHLLRYPIQIASEGKVTDLPGMEFFPRSNSRLRSALLEHIPDEAKERL